jgi:ribose 1,5-bisphosphate isomerase
MVHKDILKVVDDVRIRQMRGGTVVTHAALKALRTASLKTKASSSKEFLAELKENVKYLMRIRASSIPLSNSLRFVSLDVHQAADRGAYVKELQTILTNSSKEFDEKLESAVRQIADIGARRIKEGDVIMTHSYSSSVIAILKKAHHQHKRPRVFVTETRPELEGRDVARELAAEGIDVTLIIDSAVSHFIEETDKVLIGAEAVAANGAIVNKIGTATIASVAQRARVRVYAAASTYKFSPETMLGELIEIEERDPSYVLESSTTRRPLHFAVRNPAFDVTSPQDIDLIITERGVIPPQAAIMIVREQKGVFVS